MKWVAKEEKPLLAFLLDHSPKGRNATKAFLKRGQVLVDGQTITKHDYPLQVNQTVEIQTQKEDSKRLKGLSIVYEDDHIIVVYKEAGLLTIAANPKDQEQTAYRTLNAYVKRKYSKARIYIVHRLDRDTSGLLVFAKTAQAKNILQSEWKQRVTDRVYMAIVEGQVKKDRGTIESWLKESSTHQMYVSNTKYNAKEAVLHYQTVKRTHQHSLLEVRLDTGRKNQIRVQLASINHPIIGDKKYGAKTNPIKRLGLHALTLSFSHPITDEYLSFTSHTPESFKLS